MDSLLEVMVSLEVQLGPYERHDDVANPETFYSRKGFYALNVQYIVDHEKRVLWASNSHRDSSHYSTCFRATDVYKKILKRMQSHLFPLSYFILGDSAYAIESFILLLFDNVKGKTPEDTCNFYHSSARITVECASREIDRRFGIF